MNICMIGTGYVGLVTGACLAELGHQVWCVDSDEEKITSLNAGNLPIYEPGLQEIVARQLETGCLHFTTDSKAAIEQSLYCFITVGTPPKSKGGVDLSYVISAARSIGQFAVDSLVVVNKSTVPVGTAQRIERIIREELESRGKEQLEFDVVANPEFLREGAAIEDFMYPDRIIIGTSTERAAESMKQLYQPLTKENKPLLIMDVKSAEMTKYAANAMLATRISFMNELARLCDRVGGNIDSIHKGIGADHRIGMDFLSAGIGYGGSCFPKDVKALVHIGRKHGIEMEIVAAVDHVNERQKYYLVDLIERRFGNNLSRRKFGIWGLAFKPQTDDMREASSVTIVRSLLNMGAKIAAFDPIAIQQAQAVLSGNRNLQYVDSLHQAAAGVDALLLLTEWDVFQQVDLNDVKQLMKQPIIFDGRNQYDPNKVKAQGFEYYGVGKNYDEG